MPKEKLIRSNILLFIAMIEKLNSCFQNACHKIQNKSTGLSGGHSLNVVLPWKILGRDVVWGHIYWF